MMHMNEQIRVAAIFAPGQTVRPVWFDWKHRKHTIRETTYCWQEKVGNVTRVHFAVSDGEALFELVFNTCDQSWMLGGIEI